MSTEEPKAESPPDNKVDASASSDSSTSSTSHPANVDAAVAWPPPEAAPSSTDAASPADSGVMTAAESSPAKKPAAKPETSADDAQMPAAAPQEEMGLSNSTLHWLGGGDQAVPAAVTRA